MTQTNPSAAIKSDVLAAVKLAKLSLRTGVRAGTGGNDGSNHNEAVARNATDSKLSLRTGVKAGGGIPGSTGMNHNQAIAKKGADAVRTSLTIRTSVRAGGGIAGMGGTNHNQTRQAPR